MKKINILTVLVPFLIIGIADALDCPADSAHQIDMRAMLPDGTPNPTYGQLIATGLCACIGFSEALSTTDTSLTLTVRIVDNEPIRGIEMDIYHNSPDILVYSGSGSIAKGEKLENIADDNGIPRNMTLLANEIGDHIKVMAYSTSRAQTTGDNTEGDLFYLTYHVPGGFSSLPDSISFSIGLCNIPGTSMDPEVLNVICSYPDTNNTVAIAVSELGIIANGEIPAIYRLNQNYPNPFNPNTMISFDLSIVAPVSLVVFNLLGQSLATLVDKSLEAGYYNIEWDGTDYKGRKVASGIYFYELKAGSFVARHKMLLLR